MTASRTAQAVKSRAPSRVSSQWREKKQPTRRNHKTLLSLTRAHTRTAPHIYAHLAASPNLPCHNHIHKLRLRTKSNPKASKKKEHKHSARTARTEERPAGEDGEVAVLREGTHEQGGVDQGGGPAPDRLHQGAWRGVLAFAAQGRGPPPLRQELPPPLDELPPPGPQARQLHRRGRRAHHQAPRSARQQVVADSGAAARPDRQRDQELLEHAHQAQAPEPWHRSADAPPDQRREQRRSRGQRAHDGQHRRLPVHAAGVQARQPGPHRPEQCELREAGAVGRRPQQQRREHGQRAAVPRPEPRPRPVHGPAVLAAQDAYHRVDAHVAAAADHLSVLPPRRPQRGGLPLQDRLAGGPARVPVSQATGGGPVHIAQ